MHAAIACMSFLARMESFVCHILTVYITTYVNTGRIRSAVTDGITLGHPCCAGALNCKNPLLNNHAMYCDEHNYQMSICAVVTCQKPVTPGFKTCDEPDHCACKEYYKMMGKAMFQLKICLENTKITHPLSAMPSNVIDPPLCSGQTTGEQMESLIVNEGFGLEDEPVLVSKGNGADVGISVESIDGELECPSKPETGNRKVRARFGRKRTHNEELCVLSCGVIIGRATFYGSEGPNSVRVSPLSILFDHFSIQFNICRNSGTVSFLLKHRFQKSFGWIQIVSFQLCLQLKVTCTSHDVHFQSMFSITNANTRRVMPGVPSIVTQRCGQNS
jgi:CxC6 like cysteine cluster associated with KDZ transposases